MDQPTCIILSLACFLQLPFPLLCLGITGDPAPSPVPSRGVQLGHFSRLVLQVGAGPWGR